MSFSSPTVLVRTPKGINLSSVGLGRLFPSLSFTSPKNSPGLRTDENIKLAECYIGVTESQLDMIYNSSQRAAATYASEITFIEEELKELNSILQVVKSTRNSSHTLSNRIFRTSNECAAGGVLTAARELADKAKHTSHIVCQLRDSERQETDILFQTSASESSEYPLLFGQDLIPPKNVCGIGFSFNRRPTQDDTHKIETVIRLVCPELPFPSDDGLEDGSDSGQEKAIFPPIRSITGVAKPTVWRDAAVPCWGVLVGMQPSQPEEYNNAAAIESRTDSDDRTDSDYMLCP
ncbi:hypothetical protein BDR05DRAFT_1004668 [Suillus weaverae]|nr:hypothetical protein BDR05DRAFT_1004668 [Suillus weaverae]